MALRCREGCQSIGLIGEAKRTPSKPLFPVSSAARARLSPIKIRSAHISLDFPRTASIAVRVDGPCWVAAIAWPQCRACGGASIAMDAMPVQREDSDGQDANAQTSKGHR